MADEVVKSIGPVETYQDKRHSRKTRAPDGSSEVSASVSKDSLLAAADDIIYDIDVGIGPAARKGEVVKALGPAACKGEVDIATRQVARKGEIVKALGPDARKREVDNDTRPAARKSEVVKALGPAARKSEVDKALGPAARKGELDDTIRPAARKGELRCNAKLITTVNLNFLPGEQNARLEAFDGNGRVDLDAVEKWASSSNLDIHFNKMKKESTYSVPHTEKDERVPDKLQKADTAVAEINAIIKTVSVKASTQQLKQPIFKSQSSSAAKSIKVPSPVPSSVTNQFNSDLPAILPITPHAKPLQSIRLPPVRTASLPSEDIFHRKLEDMSLLHIPHCLPKLEPLNPKAISKEKSFSDINEEVKYSYKASTPDQAAKISPQYLLPGQVQEKSSEEELNGVVEVRTIVLDYSSTKKTKTQMERDNRCGLTKLCTRLCCCRMQTYEADDLEQENMETVNATKKRSLPVRIWKRVKRCFGF